MLDLLLSLPRTQIRLQHPLKDLQEHLEAHSRDYWIVAAFAQLVADKRMLGVRHFVQREHDTFVLERFADQIPSGTGYMGVFLPEDLCMLVHTGYSYTRLYLLTMTISPLISPALAKLSSFPPAPGPFLPRVPEWTSVAK
jgi:hypothetical protein